MSTWSWKQKIWESKLSATTKIVLQALASHLNDFGDPMFPSQERLAKLCSLSERAIITHLQVAEDEGWIKPRKRELKGKKWAANEYIACWPDGVNDVPSRGEPRSPDGVKEVHPNSPSELSSKNNPPTPKGEPDGFEEIWKAKWSRGNAPNPRQPALKAYAAALKRGSLPADILAGVKARVGVDKEDTVYAPQLVTWLNQERWKDGTGAAVLSAVDLEAAERRLAESKRRHDEDMRRRVEEKSAQLRGAA
ncbi:hypothetical protein ABIB06_006585 [Bradyrhizobium sp. LB8.2]|uniref:helix-turn-helix domain-containing protein n=1 Tax=unclassified Bradyrhizobium TaxID=2631580 RepID=UPI0033958CD5